MTNTIGKLGQENFFEPGFDVSIYFDLRVSIFSTQRPPYIAHILLVYYYKCFMFGVVLMKITFRFWLQLCVRQRYSNLARPLIGFIRSD